MIRSIHVCGRALEAYNPELSDLVYWNRIRVGSLVVPLVLLRDRKCKLQKFPNDSSQRGQIIVDTLVRLIAAAISYAKDQYCHVVTTLSYNTTEVNALSDRRWYRCTRSKMGYIPPCQIVQMETLGGMQISSTGGRGGDIKTGCMHTRKRHTKMELTPTGGYQDGMHTCMHGQYTHCILTLTTCPLPR